MSYSRVRIQMLIFSGFKFQIMKRFEKLSEFPKTGLVVLCIIQRSHVFSCVDALNTGNSDTAFITALNEQMYWVSKKPCLSQAKKANILQITW